MMLERRIWHIGTFVAILLLVVSTRIVLIVDPWETLQPVTRIH
jgi:hypothetical protein